MNSSLCSEMLGDLLHQWSEDNGKKRGFCLLKGCPCEGPACMAWAPIVSFCRNLCPKRADCRSRMSDLVGTLDRPA
nr:hypothetical protein [Desulfovibrio sp.]